MTTFIDETVAQIDARLEALSVEAIQLTSARKALIDNGSSANVAIGSVGSSGVTYTSSGFAVVEPKVSKPKVKRTRKPKQVANGETKAKSDEPTVYDRVVAMLQESDEPLTGSQVSASLGISRNHAATVLSKAAKSGKLEKTERGYRIQAA